MVELSLSARLSGCLLGMAIGDALGLACEGLSPQRQRRLFESLDGYHFLGHRGMVSDDTEHACMTAQALIVAPEDPDRFAHVLGWQLRLWLLGLPAGVGLATLRACIRLWMGFSPVRSGVVSAGNGPAMRSVILGVALGQDPERMRRFVEASSLLTHRDPRALAGALAIAQAAWMESQGQKDSHQYLQALAALCPNQPAFVELIEQTLERRNQPLETFLDWLGCSRGISGYMLHSVPAVIWFWQQDDAQFQPSLSRLIRCGGDTDTVAAILGGILGAGLGASALPPQLLSDLCEWPRSVNWIEELARRLALSLEGQPQSVPRLNPLALLGRNLVFLLIVLAHGFRRLAPPY